jgi:predicted nucleic acid-binding Zn ribbon protein
MGRSGCAGGLLVLRDARHRNILMNERDRQRRRALIAFQIFIYGYLLLMFGIQLSMWATRNW